jgi:ATP-dependent Clp protease ATP-binding subunit ClpA
MVTQLNQNLAHKKLSVTVSEEAKQWILDKACKDKNYGARPLRRAIQRYIEDPLSEALIQGQLKEVPNVEVYLEGTSSGTARRPRRGWRSANDVKGRNCGSDYRAPNSPRELGARVV